MGQRVLVDARLRLTDLAPAQRVVAVGIEADRRIEIAQRDIPATVQGISGDLQLQIAAARRVRRCQSRKQGERQSGEPACAALHGLPAVSCARSRCRRGSSIPVRSEEHTSELQSLMRISYAVFCLKKKTISNTPALFQLTTTEYYSLSAPPSHHILSQPP